MIELLERQKKLTANQWKLIVTGNLADLLDFFDFFLIGYVLAFVIGSWHLTFGQSALILLSSGLGAVPGAFFWGWMADRIGRREVFIATALNAVLFVNQSEKSSRQGRWRRTRSSPLSWTVVATGRAGRRRCHRSIRPSIM